MGHPNGAGGRRGRARIRGVRIGLAVLVVLALALAVAACGGDDEVEVAAPVEEEPAAEVEPDEPDVDADLGVQWTEPAAGEFWYAGFRVELSEAELVLEEEWDEVVGKLTIRAMFDNLTDDTAGWYDYGLDEMILYWDGEQEMAGRDSELDDVPAGGTNRGQFVFDVPDDFTLAGAELHAGSPAQQHAVIPLDGEGEVVDLAPVELDVAGSGTVDEVEVEVTGAELQAYGHRRNEQLDAGDLSLGLTVDVGYSSDARGSQYVGSDMFVLELPDGRTVTPDAGPNLALSAGETAYDEVVSFIVGDPPEGDYVLVIAEGDEEFTVEFTIP